MTRGAGLVCVPIGPRPLRTLGIPQIPARRSIRPFAQPHSYAPYPPPSSKPA